jgi:hypothetical protein
MGGDVIEFIQAPESEKAVISAALVDEDTANSIVEVLGDIEKPFTDEFLAACFDLLRRMVKAGETIDGVLFVERLYREFPKPDSNGVPYPWASALSPIIGIGCSAMALDYCEAVIEATQRRDIEKHSKALTKAARDGNTEATLAAHQAIEAALAQTSTHTMKFLDTAALISSPPPEEHFIVDGLLPAGTLAGLNAEGGTGKSFFLLSLAAGLAVGKTVFPSCSVGGARPVLILCAEDAPDDVHRRLARILEAHEFTDTEKKALEASLHISCCGVSPLMEATRTGAMKRTRFFSEVEAQIKAIQPALVVMDPRAAFFAGEENSNAQVSLFVYSVAGLARLVDDGCSVVFAHHTAKGGHGADLSSGRGASAARDGMRAVLYMEHLSEKEIEEAGISNPALFCKVSVTKSNYAERRPAPIYFQRDTGRTGGVLREVDLQTSKREIQAGMLEHAGKALAGLIGENEAGLSKRDILRLTSGKEIRDALQDEFPQHMKNRNDIEAAFDVVVAKGWINIESTPIGGKTREVPRGWTNG